MTERPFPPHQTAVPGPRSRDWIQRLRAAECPQVTFCADDGSFPIFWESGHGCTVVDVDGNHYLDLTSAFGVAALGHADPVVAQAIGVQASRLVHGMGDVHPNPAKIELMERIASLTPPGLDMSLLGTSGGDAVEAAIKTARLATGKPGVVAFTGGYHGLNLGALALTHRSDFREPFDGQVPGFTTHLPYGDPIAKLPPEVGAVVVEPIQGRGGIVVPPAGWLASLREACRRHGALLIFDEIFTGWGRTGTWFACQYEEVVPDILCIGKAMGGGMPISACVASRSIMDAWGTSTGEALHTSTFLGHPLSCAAACAAIDRMVALDVPRRAQEAGQRFRDGLEKLQRLHPDKVLEVRGRGLMLGIQFACPAAGPDLARRALSEGLIVLPAGDGSVVELTPPLIIESPEIDWAVEVLETLVGAM